MVPATRAADRLMPDGTFTRASTATYIGADGFRHTVGPNVPRRRPEGFLFEGERTNFVLHSNRPPSQIIHLGAGTYCLSFYGGGKITLSAPGHLILLADRGG